MTRRFCLARGKVCAIVTVLPWVKAMLGHTTDSSVTERHYFEYAKNQTFEGFRNVN